MAMRPLRRLAYAVAALILVGAACGRGGNSTDAASDGVASISDSADGSDANGPTNAADPDLEAPEDPELAFELFNECMSDAGLGFGAVVSVGPGDGNGSGAIRINPEDLPDDIDPQADGSPEDFDFDQFQEANERCEGHLANIDGLADLSPEEQAAFEDAQLEFSRCMEEQGIEMPEIDGTGGGAIAIGSVEEIEVDPQTGRPSFDDLDFEAFNEAAEECGHHLEALDGIRGDS